MRSFAKEYSYLTAVRQYAGFLDWPIDDVSDDLLKDAARRYFLELSTGYGDQFLLERAWLKALSCFLPSLDFMFPHIDPLLTGKATS